jgi:hypothetical protein
MRRRLMTLVAVVSLTTLVHGQKAPVRVIASNGVKTLVEELVPAMSFTSTEEVP